MKRQFLLSVGLILLSCPLPTLAAAAPTGNTAMLQKISPRTIRHRAKQRRWEEQAQSRFTYDAALSQLYRSDAYDFSIRFPKGRRSEEIFDRNGAVTTVVLFLSPLGEQDTSQENVNLVVEDIAGTYKTIDDYTEMAIAQERELFDGYKLHSSVPLQIEGLPAHAVSYDALFKGKLLSFEQVWILKDGKVYVWTLAAVPETFDVFSGQFRRMINTMSFRPASNS